MSKTDDDLSTLSCNEFSLHLQPATESKKIKCLYKLNNKCENIFVKNFS